MCYIHIMYSMYTYTINTVFYTASYYYVIMIFTGWPQVKNMFMFKRFIQTDAKLELFGYTIEQIRFYGASLIRTKLFASPR